MQQMQQKEENKVGLTILVYWIIPGNSDIVLDSLSQLYRDNTNSSILFLFSSKTKIRHGICVCMWVSLYFLSGKSALVKFEYLKKCCLRWLIVNTKLNCADAFRIWSMDIRCNLHEEPAKKGELTKIGFVTVHSSQLDVTLTKHLFFSAGHWSVFKLLISVALACSRFDEMLVFCVVFVWIII